jgi:hypothetical protein
MMNVYSTSHIGIAMYTIRLYATLLEDYRIKAHNYVVVDKMRLVVREDSVLSCCIWSNIIIHHPYPWSI